MNKNIRNLNLEEILFFDIETVRKNKTIDLDSKEFELYSWSLRDKTTGFIPPAIEVSKHYEKNGALKPEFNKVVVLSVGFVKDSVLYYKAITGTQKEIVEEFYNLVISTGFKVCGHNIIGFDLPVLRIKAFEEGIDFSIIPENINDSGKKPWDLEKFIIDTMKIITGSYFYNLSLDSACMLKGIKSSKDDISGAYVSQVYYDEGINRIATYCNKDVIATAELFCALQGNPGVITSYVDRGGEELKKKEPINVLEHILGSGQLSSPVINKIVEFTEEQDLNRENVLTLVKTALSKSKEYQKVNEEDYDELEEALGIKIDYSKIQVVVDKGNLGKEQLISLINLYPTCIDNEWGEIIDLTKQYLTRNNKLEQKATKKYFDILTKYYKISSIVIKGSLGKKEADSLTNLYENSSVEEKKEIVSLTEKFLTENGKIGQKRAKEAFDYLKEKLK